MIHVIKMQNIVDKHKEAKIRPRHQ